MNELWTEVLIGVADAVAGVQKPIERLSNRIWRWALLIRQRVAKRRASR